MHRPDAYLGLRQRQLAAAGVAQSEHGRLAQPELANLPSSSSIFPFSGSSSSHHVAHRQHSQGLAAPPRQPATSSHPGPLVGGSDLVPRPGESIRLGGPCATSTQTAVSQPAQCVGQEQVIAVGGRAVNPVVDPSGHKAVPWAAELRASLLPSPGWEHGGFGPAFCDILSVRLCASTVAPYASKLRQFLSFCESEGKQVGPASTHTIYEYLAFLSLEGAVQPKSWPQYIAVISSMHRDSLLPTPWLDSGLCSTFVQSASKLASAAAEEHPSRKPLLAEHVLLFLRAALFSTDLKLLRAVVAVTLAFLTFARGASVMALVKEDVQVSDKGFEVRVWDEKTRKGAGIARSIAVSIVDCPLVGQVVLRNVQRQAAAFGPTRQPRGFVQLPGEPFPLRVSSTHACSSVWQLSPWMGCTGQPSRGILVGRGVSVHCMPLGAASPVLLPGGDGHL